MTPSGLSHSEIHGSKLVTPDTSFSLSQEQESKQRLKSRHRDPRCLSWGWMLFRVLICAAVADSLGCRLPPRARHFWRLPYGLPGGTVPRSLARPGSSSRELVLPFRVLATSTPPSARRRQTPCRRVCPPSRHQLAESTDGPGSQARPSCSALGVSHALDGLLLRVPCRLVSSRSHVQGSHSRGF
jgi:hypothetical protein